MRRLYTDATATERGGCGAQGSSVNEGAATDGPRSEDGVLEFGYTEVVDACAWLSEAQKAALHRHRSDTAKADGPLAALLSPHGPSAQTTDLHLPDKRLLLSEGRGGAPALRFAATTTTILQVLPELSQLARKCLFVGDSILAVDDVPVATEAELLQVLEPKPAGAPLKLTLLQPAVVAAIRGFRGETVCFAGWVANLGGGSGGPAWHADAAASRAAEVASKAPGFFAAILANHSNERRGGGSGLKGGGNGEESDRRRDGGAASLIGGGAADVSSTGGGAGGDAARLAVGAREEAADDVALLVVSSQRVRLLRFWLRLERQSVLNPEHTGTSCSLSIYLSKCISISLSVHIMMWKCFSHCCLFMAGRLTRVRLVLFLSIYLNVYLYISLSTSRCGSAFPTAACPWRAD